MDINGAKALRDRLGSSGADEAPPTTAGSGIPEDAPPVYHWLGVRQAETSRRATGDTPSAQSTSLFRRFGLSFR